jgi:PAS domain S-box-containing protein
MTNIPPYEETPAAWESPVWKKLLTLMAMGIGLFGLWLTSRISYLLFHSLAETFAVLIAWGMFIVAWNTRRFMVHGFFLFLGVAFLGVGGLDLVHLLAYKGMGVFPKATVDLATQLWIAARYLEAGSFLLAPVYLTRRVRGWSLLSAYILAATLLLTAVFGGWFPVCFVEGQGLTPFKVASEYIICGLLAGGAFFLWRRREYLDRRVSRLVIGSLGLSIATELAFTLYGDVYGLFNQIGHILKIMAFILLYQGMIETGLRRPYQALFRELAESEGRYRMLFETMTEGFALHEIITDEQGRPCDYRFLEVNPVFERLTGLKRNDLIGRPVLEVLPGTEPFWIESYGRVALDGVPAHFERFFPPLNRWYQVFAYRPHPGRFAVIFTDITERKQSEESLRGSQEQNRVLGELLEHSDQPFAVAYPSGSLGYFNGAFERLTGYDREELQRIDWDRTLTPPEWREAEAARLEELQCTGEPVLYEKEYLRKDGSRVPIELLVHLVRDEQGHPLHYYSFITDLTERKHVEEALQATRLAALNLMEDAVEARQKAEKVSAELEQSAHRLQRAHDELEARVQERTADLTTAIQALQLEISQREELEETLRTSEQQVRFFAAQCLTTQEQERKRIAGELHDSLASTLVAAKYRLEKAALQVEPGIALQDSLQYVIAILGGLNKEIRRIMVDLRPAVLDDLGLIPALNWFCREFQKTYSQIRVEKQTELSESDLAEALKTPIFRLTQEALNNIAKHSEAGLVTLSLAKVNSRIVLIIRDDGRGFDPGEVARGLGLSTMKERTELSGGEYRLESAPGKGTVLFASWPLEA